MVAAIEPMPQQSFGGRGNKFKKEAAPDSTLEELRKRIDSLEEQIKVARSQAKTSTTEEETSTKTKKSK